MAKKLKATVTVTKVPSSIKYNLPDEFDIEMTLDTSGIIQGLKVENLKPIDGGDDFMVLKSLQTPQWGKLIRMSFLILSLFLANSLKIVCPKIPSTANRPPTETTIAISPIPILSVPFLVVLNTDLLLLIY